ncbi:MAG: hypothetical protein MZU97_19440 [Bacillus subtilis]|nr:hypothetical protein [Bacillus subtilis]
MKQMHCHQRRRTDYLQHRPFDLSDRRLRSRAQSLAAWLRRRAVRRHHLRLYCKGKSMHEAVN